MPGFKFHIVTVVGVFVALALGIVIGTSLSDNIIIESQMSTIELMQNRINSLEVHRAELIEQTQELMGNINYLHSNEEVLFNLAIKNFDDIENLTLIAYGDVSELWEIDLVQKNKIHFENIIVVNQDKLLNSEGLRIFLEVEQNVEEVFSERLASFMHNEDDTSIKYLEQLEVISYRGEYNFNNQQFINYFQGDEQDDLLMITTDRLHELNQRVFAITNLGSIPNLDNNIVEIGNIERTIAQIELLQILDEEIIQVITE